MERLDSPSEESDASVLTVRTGSSHVESDASVTFIKD